MDLVKASPGLGRQRTEHWMVEHPGTGSESLFGVGQRSIHRHQCIVKVAQRIISQPSERHGLLKRFDSGWKLANAQDVSALQLLPYIRLSAQGLAGLHSPQETRGCRGVGEHQVLKDLR